MGMSGGDLERLASVLVGHCARVRRGDLVTIVADVGAWAGAEAVFAEVLRAGGHPEVWPRSEGLQELVLEHGGEEQLRWVCPIERKRLELCDVLMVLLCPANTRRMTGMDAGRMAMQSAARRGLMRDSMRRAAEGKMRYVLSVLPGQAGAQEAGMSLRRYAEFVRRAGFLHREDPLAAWRELEARQARMCEFLRGARELRFKAPPLPGGEGTDLRVDVSGRRWVNCAAGENFPDGEVFSGPVGADGVVELEYPAVYKGVAVEGVRLRFAGGRVVEASARRNEGYLVKMLEMDAGARVMGEIALGTNPEIRGFTGDAFFDEKIGGTFHIAVGAGYPETGNTNQSGLHWDMVSDLRRGGTMHADGELVQENGRFVREGWPGA